MSKNIEICYLYRDGGNNKRCQSVVLDNPGDITPEQLEESIRTPFADLQTRPHILHFQPEKLGWPTAYFPGHDMNGEDLNVHEVDRIVLTDKAAPIEFDIPRW